MLKIFCDVQLLDWEKNPTLAIYRKLKLLKLYTIVSMKLLSNLN